MQMLSRDIRLKILYVIPLVDNVHIGLAAVKLFMFNKFSIFVTTHSFHVSISNIFCY